VNFCFDQIIVKIQPASPRQPDIENEASGEVWAGAVQEFLHGAEQLDAQAYGSEKVLERLAYVLIVINDDDGGSRLVIRDGHLRSFWS
jgi:hypothetical protein